MTWTCTKCNQAPATKIWRCEACYTCDDCGRKSGLESPLCTYGKDAVRCSQCERKRLDKLLSRCKKKPPNTVDQHNAICPHCGYEHTDAWEYDEGERECNQCGLSFDLTKRMWVTFTTRKKER
jgi:hypothetical protein